MWSKGSCSNVSPIAEPDASMTAISSFSNRDSKSDARKALTHGVLLLGFAIITLPAAIADAMGDTKRSNG